MQLEKVQELIGRLAYYDHENDTDVVSELVATINEARENDYDHDEVVTGLRDLFDSLVENSIIEDDDHLIVATEVFAALPSLISAK